MNCMASGGCSCSQLLSSIFSYVSQCEYMRFKCLFLLFAGKKKMSNPVIKGKYPFCHSSLYASKIEKGQDVVRSYAQCIKVQDDRCKLQFSSVESYYQSLCSMFFHQSPKTENLRLCQTFSSFISFSGMNKNILVTNFILGKTLGLLQFFTYIQKDFDLYMQILICLSLHRYTN